MGKVMIPWEHLEALGGRVEGDPDCRETLYTDGSKAWPLPESGALVLRVLWRYLGESDLTPMEVPTLQRDDCDESMGWFMETVDGVCSDWFEFGHITDPCEALRAIVAAEVAKKERDDA